MTGDAVIAIENADGTFTGIYLEQLGEASYAGALYNKVKSQCVAYHRDRDEDLEKYTETDWHDLCSESYFYVYSRTHGWLVTRTGDKLHKLSAVLCKDKDLCGSRNQMSLMDKCRNVDERRELANMLRTLGILNVTPDIIENGLTDEE